MCVCVYVHLLVYLLCRETFKWKLFISFLSLLYSMPTCTDLGPFWGPTRASGFDLLLVPLMVFFISRFICFQTSRQLRVSHFPMTVYNSLYSYKVIHFHVPSLFWKEEEKQAYVHIFEPAPRRSLLIITSHCQSRLAG